MVQVSTRLDTDDGQGLACCPSNPPRNNRNVRRTARNRASATGHVHHNFRITKRAYSDSISLKVKPKKTEHSLKPVSSENDTRVREKINEADLGNNQVFDGTGKLKGEDQLVNKDDVILLQRSGERRLSGNITKHPACAPIMIPTEDPFYSQFNRKCLNFVRNAASPTHGCVLGAREQANQVTGWA